MPLKITGPNHQLDMWDVVVAPPRGPQPTTAASAIVTLEVIKPSPASSLHLLATVNLTPDQAERLALALIRAAERTRMRTTPEYRALLAAAGGDLTGGS